MSAGDDLGRLPDSGRDEDTTGAAQQPPPEAGRKPEPAAPEDEAAEDGSLTADEQVALADGGGTPGAV